MLKNMTLPYFQADWEPVDPLSSAVSAFPDNVLFSLTPHASGTDFKSLTTKDSVPDQRSSSVIMFSACMHKTPSIKRKERREEREGGRREKGKERERGRREKGGGERRERRASLV